MKAIIKNLTVPLFLLFCFCSHAANPFDCGSTGAYGPMNITQDTTLDMPTNGIFHCTTITVASGATLRFNRNPLNTPVYLLATGDVLINGTIDVPGSFYGNENPGPGGPGGFDGGYGGSMYEGQQQGGDGLGPGGGKRGATIYGRFVGVYGNLLLTPLIGGSGGAGSDGSPGKGGGGGGGAILIGSNSKIFINGSIKANGSNSYSGGTGSGGAIRLIAPIVGGMGFLSTYDTSSGRIRIDCQDNQSYRSLSVSGLTSRGNRMIIFPEVIQRLNILEVAGQSIAENTASGVTLELPTGASTNQVVKVQARNFTNDVPIRVVVTPEHGSSGQFDATILQSSGNPPFANVNVVIPAGSVCKIHAWTR